MWRTASRVVGGLTVAVAIVVLAMIARMADDPTLVILVPPPGVVSPYASPTSVVDIVAAQQAEQAESAADPATTSNQQRAGTPPKPVTRQTATNTPNTPATGATTPAPVPPAAQPPATSQSPAIVCPDVASALPAVPSRAQTDVTRELRYLDTILAEANRRLRAEQNNPDPGFVQNAIVGPLVNQRIASLDRITIAIGRFAPRPTGLERLARCSVR